MNRKSQKALMSAACAAVLSAGATVVYAAPLVQLQLRASTSLNGAFTPTLSGLTSGQTVYFEITDILAPVGTVNGSNTITSETSVDGINKLNYNLSASSGVSFASATLAKPTSTPSSTVDFTAGTGAKAYTTFAASALTNCVPVAATGTYDGAIAGGAANVLEFGSLTFTGNSTVTASYGGTGAISFNGGAKRLAISTGGADPITSYGTALTLSAGSSTLTWSGQVNGSWDIGATANFSGQTYTDGSAVTFGDKAADGTTAVQNTTPVTIVAGGVAPASVSFTNNTASYTISGADATGIKGAATVTLSGTGTVNFSTANTYSGNTTISAGTLRANNAASGSATGTSNITVAGGTLGGNGTVTGTVALNSGGIAAGADAVTTGKLATGAITASGGTKYTWKINDATGTAGTTDGWDDVAAASLTFSSLSSGSPFTVSLKSLSGGAPGAPANLAPGQSFIIAESNGGTISINGTTYNSGSGTVNLAGGNTPAQLANLFALDTSGFTPAGSFSLDLQNISGHEDLTLTYAAAPEPTSALLGFAGAVPMILARRRRKH